MATTGRIEQDRLPDGQVRYRVTFTLEGERIRISHVPSPTGEGRIPLTSRKAALEALYQIRADIVNQGLSLAQVLALWIQTTAAEDLVENRLELWIEHLAELARQGRRSPTYLREHRRYALEDGHFSWWRGRTIHGITYGELEDWHKWLGRRGLAPKTQKNVSDAFRSFLSRLKRRGEIRSLPDFPVIDVPEYAPRIVSLDAQARILEAIPWERRGAFLAAATEALRLGEIRAVDLDDYRDGRLRVTQAIQGSRLDAPRRHTKTRSGEWREVWHPELLRWIEWRLEQAPPARRVAGELALFWNPTARNAAKRWTPDPMEREWRRACEAVGEDVPLQEGTRHATLTAFGAVLSDRMLQAFSRHRDAKSLGRYSKPRPTRAAIRRLIPKDES